jgi:hypothetical protein
MATRQNPWDTMWQREASNYLQTYHEARELEDLRLRVFPEL